MNRAFPPETIRSCDHCGRDITCVVTDDGLEANDQRDYVWADNGVDSVDWVFICQLCKTAVGIGDPNDI